MSLKTLEENWPVQALMPDAFTAAREDKKPDFIKLNSSVADVNARRAKDGTIRRVF